MRTMNATINTAHVNPVLAFGKPKSPNAASAPVQTEKNYTYLTTQELADRIRYSVIAVRNELKDSVLIEGVHYFRPFGGRKLLFIWEVIEEDMRAYGSQFSFGAR